MRAAFNITIHQTKKKKKKKIAQPQLNHDDEMDSG
jgi:hypothetical protein